MPVPLLSQEAVANDYDKIFKLFAEEDPRDLLALFAGIPPDAPVKVKPLPREIMLPSLQVDHVYEVTREGKTFLVHFEVTTRFRAEVCQHCGTAGAGSGFEIPASGGQLLCSAH